MGLDSLGRYTAIHKAWDHVDSFTLISACAVSYAECLLDELKRTEQ